MDKNVPNTHKRIERQESVAVGIAFAFMIALSVVGLAKPDAVLSRHAPLAVEAVR